MLRELRAGEAGEVQADSDTLGAGARLRRAREFAGEQNVWKLIAAVAEVGGYLSCPHVHCMAWHLHAQLTPE
jgi:hypothetical protein